MLWQDPERCHLRGKPILREQSQSVVESAAPSSGGGMSGQESKAGWGEGLANTGCTYFLQPASSCICSIGNKSNVY